MTFPSRPTVLSRPTVPAGSDQQSPRHDLGGLALLLGHVPYSAMVFPLPRGAADPASRWAGLSEDAATARALRTAERAGHWWGIGRVRGQPPLRLNASKECRSRAFEKPESAAPFPAGERFGLFRQILARLQAFRSLNRLSERHLRDIGLTPDDIATIRRVPLSSDVSTRLAIAAGSRAGNW